MAGSKSEVAELVAAIRKTGHKVAKSGPRGKHFKVLRPNGQVVTDDNGPLIISGSPGEHRFWEMHVHRLIAAKVLKDDPKKVGQRAKDRSQENGDAKLSADEARIARVEGNKAAARRRAERTTKVRARIEPLVAKTGGWRERGGTMRSGVSVHELGVIAFYWHEKRGTKERFPTEGAAAQSANQNIKKGGTLSDRNAALWEMFASEWEKAQDARRWYTDLVRESKGLAPTKVHGEQAPPEPPPAASPPPERSRPVPYAAHAKLPEHVGKLALRAVYLMTAGQEEPDEDAILKVGEEILALEKGGDGS